MKTLLSKVQYPCVAHDSTYNYTETYLFTKEAELIAFCKKFIGMFNESFFDMTNYQVEKPPDKIPKTLHEDYQLLYQKKLKDYTISKNTYEEFSHLNKLYALSKKEDNNALFELTSLLARDNNVVFGNFSKII